MKNRQKFLTRVGMLAVVAFLVLPMSAFAQGNQRGRRCPDCYAGGPQRRHNVSAKSKRRDVNVRLMRGVTIRATTTGSVEMTTTIAADEGVTGVVTVPMVDHFRCVKRH